MVVMEGLENMNKWPQESLAAASRALDSRMGFQGKYLTVLTMSGNFCIREAEIKLRQGGRAEKNQVWEQSKTPGIRSLKI